MTGEYKGWVDYLIKTTDQIEVVKPGGEELRFVITENTAQDLADFAKKGKLS